MGRLPHTTLAKMEFHLQLPPPSVEFHSSNMLREMLTFHHFPKIYASKKTVTKPLKKNETTFPLDSSVNLRMGLPAEEVQLHPQKTEEWVKVSELRCAAEAAAGLLGLPPEGAVSAPLAGAGPAGKMAPSTLLRPFSRLLTPAGLPSGSSARSKFYVRDPPDDNKANWLKVGLTLGTTVFLWFYLIKEHHEDVLEYKRRNGLE